MKQIIILFLFFHSSKVFGQNTSRVSSLTKQTAELLSLPLEDTTITDTVRFYKKNSGIGIKIYIKAWQGKGYSYSLDKITRQDSLALGLMKQPQKTHYIQLLNHKLELVFEGLISSDNYLDFKYIMGEGKFYKKGMLSRIEYWELMEYHDTCGVYTSEFIEPSRVWYYYKNKKLRKTKTFKLTINCISKNCNKTTITTWYSKKGEIKRVRKRSVLW